MDSFLGLLIRASKKPRTIWLCIWAFGRLWWVDRNLQALAINALQLPGFPANQPLSQELKKEVDRRVAVIASVGNYHPCRPQCLHRSLVLYLWLRRKGIVAQLELGWGDRIGHAWVSYGGHILNDSLEITQLKPRLIKI